MEEIITNRKRFLSDNKMNSPTSPTKMLVNLTMQKINSQNIDWNSKIDIEQYLFANKQVIQEKKPINVSDSTQCSSNKIEKNSVSNFTKMTVAIEKEETGGDKNKQPLSGVSSHFKKSDSKAKENDSKNYEKSPTLYESKPKKTTLKRTLSNPEFNFETSKEFDQKHNIKNDETQLEKSISMKIRVLSKKGEYTELFFYFFEFFLKRRLMKIKFKRA